MRCLDSVASMYKINSIESEQKAVSHFNAVLENLNTTLLDKHATKDFSHVFEKYIHG
jgi:hypothetical protein